MNAGFDGLVTLETGQVRVSASGSGAPLIWCHGIFFPIDVDDQSTLGAVLRDVAGLRVVRFDARGHGGTAAGLDAAAHRWSSISDDVLALADALGFDRFCLGGISMGAAVALHAALRAPERVQAMLLFALPTAWETREPERARYRDLLALETPERLADHVHADLVKIFDGGPLPPALQSMVEALRGSPWTTLERVIEGAADSDMPGRELLAELDIPITIRPWPNDTGHPLSTAHALAAVLPNADVQLLESFDDEHGMREAFARLREQVSATAPR